MKIFNCDACRALVFFENVTCLSCGHALGFLPDIMAMAALEPEGQGAWRSLATPSRGGHYRACANGQNYAVCNWFIPVGEAHELCAACRLNSVVPDDTQVDNHARWHRAEIAKRRLIYTLLRLGLPMEGKSGASFLPLRFRFQADVPGSPPVLTEDELGVTSPDTDENPSSASGRAREGFDASGGEPFRRACRGGPLGRVVTNVRHPSHSAENSGEPQDAPCRRVRPTKGLTGNAFYCNQIQTLKPVDIRLNSRHFTQSS